MKNFSQVQKILSGILKIIVIISAVVGVFLSAAAGNRAFMGGSRVLMYFTIQSNIALAIICAIGLFMILKNKDITDAWKIIKFVGTVSITLTGVVFGLVLAPTIGPDAWNLKNLLTHLVVPVVSVIDFFVVFSSLDIERKNVFYVIIPPLLYAIYAGIGYVLGWQFATGRNYPYFFLNWGSPAGAFGFTNGLPFMGTAWWIIVLLLFLIGVGNLYISLAQLVNKNLHHK